MSRPRYAFRPSPQHDSHMRAWEYLQAVPEGQRNDFLVQAILRMREDTVLEETLRKMLREELQATLSQYGNALAFPKENAASESPDEAPIPQEMLGFLTDLMRND